MHGNVRLLLVVAIFCLIGVMIPMLRTIAAPTSSPTTPANLTPDAAIARLFTSTPIQTGWFTDHFVAQIPITQVTQIVDSLKTSLGAFERVQPDRENYRVVFAKGSVPTTIVLTPQGQIAGLWFGAPMMKLASVEAAIAQFQALSGTVSVAVMEGSTERAVLNADKPWAIGSAFKLLVLETLQAQIATGQRRWQDVVTLKPEWKSLPSGILQTWPDGSPLTLQTLASLMISQSDNTATDILIHTVGREAIEKLSDRNRPFLTTREFFILKSAANANLRDRYRSADVTQKRALLKDVATLPLPQVSEFTGDLINPDIEWFFSTKELCQHMNKVKDLPLMSINPGIANAKDWQRVAFKGGSEPGVYNLTTWLQSKKGKQFCVSATWNQDKAIDDTQFISLYSSLIDLLKD